MSQIEVKLGAEIISEDRRIWLVHAGHQRRLLRHFFEQNKIFLEMPGLGLTKSVLDDEHVLRQRIKFSEALRAAGGLTRDGRTIQMGDFDGSPDRAISQAVRVVRHMFIDMKVGDLVVVPTGGAYTPVRFGEVASEFAPQHADRVGRYDYADLPARQVDWLPVERLKRDMPVDLVRLLEKPPAVSEIHRTDRTEKFFEYAYPSYIKKDEGWSLISAPGYDGNDPLAIVAPHELISFCVAMYWASENEANLKGLSFHEIIKKYYSVKDIEDFGVSFASPGKLGFKTRNPKLAAFVTALVAILGAGVISAASVGQMPHVELSTTSRTVPAEIQQTERQLDYAMKAIDSGVVTAALERSEKSKQDVDLKADATVRADE